MGNDPEKLPMVCKMRELNLSYLTLEATMLNNGRGDPSRYFL